MTMSEPIKCPLCGVIFDPEEDGCIEVSNGSQVETACLECGYKIMDELLDCLGKIEDQGMSCMKKAEKSLHRQAGDI